MNVSAASLRQSSRGGIHPYIDHEGLKRNNKTVNRRGVMCPQATGGGPPCDMANLRGGLPDKERLSVPWIFCTPISLIGFE
ncbi:hypothetical protein WA026_008255 [Henosepilachna vigintioctopunctata]|uniref:Uncharacterized protein n=1 Tax=Henosepilachna vigintioctopunctata TaxID=420089 RepID=A0AAW1TQP3_9CUCU